MCITVAGLLAGIAGGLVLYYVRDVLPPYIRKQRETFPRAYEPWCTEEKEIICELMQKTNHLSIFIECLQRTGQAIQIQIEGKNN